MTNLLSVREEFPALQRDINGHSLTYFDSAASNLKPVRVAERISKHYLLEASNVHRGIHQLSDEATSNYESVRDQVQKFLGAEFREEIIFTKGTTDSVNLVAQSFAGENFKKGDKVLLSLMEHHSNIVPWQIQSKRFGFDVEFINLDKNGDIDFSDLMAKLDGSVRLISLVHVSNSTGAVNDIRRIIQECRKKGDIKVMVDAAQSVAHMPVNVKDLDCDFLAFSGHKIFGPTGVGVLYGRKTLLTSMPPYQGGGAMIDRVTISGTTYGDLPYRFEAGTPHIGGVIGLGEALSFVNDLDVNKIKEHESHLISEVLDRLSAIEGVKVIGTPQDRSSIVSFVVPDVHHHDLASLLNNYGIAVRSGHHCTQPLMKFFGLEGTVRVSLSVFSSAEDISRLELALKKSIEMLR